MGLRLTSVVARILKIVSVSLYLMGREFREEIMLIIYNIKFANAIK